MNTDKLLEMARFDASGVLDPEEREEFEAAFRAASPAAQAQVRREQLIIARSRELQGSGEPPIGLRARVLAAWREAVQSSSTRKAAAGATTFQKPFGVNSLWRIGAIGSLAAAVVFGFVAFQIRTDNQTMQDALTSNYWNDHALQEYGSKFDQAFFNPSTRMVSFSPAPTHDSATPSKATLLWDPANKRGQIYCKDLPADQGEYEVVLVDKSGQAVKALITFPASPAGVKNQTIEGLSFESSSTLAIRRVGSNEPILTTQGL